MEGAYEDGSQDAPPLDHELRGLLSKKNLEEVAHLSSRKTVSAA